MATPRSSLDDARPSRLPTPRSSMSIDPTSPTSPTTFRNSFRPRSPNATPMPGYPSPRLPSSIPAIMARKASNPVTITPNRTNSTGQTNSPKLSNPSPKPTVSRTADKPGPRSRTTSGVSKASSQSHASRASPKNKKTGQQPVSPGKKQAIAAPLPQPESPVQPSPVKPKPRLGGVGTPNSTPSRPPAPGSRQPSGVFPPLDTTPSPSRSVAKLPAVVWPVNDKQSANGSFGRDWNPSLRMGHSGPTSEVYDTGIPLGSESMPQFRPEDDAMTMELITEVDDGGELDEDMQAALHNVHITHVKKLTHYKRLLEGAQTSSASQLHALQAELRILRTKLEDEKKRTQELEMRANKDREALKMAQMRSVVQPVSMAASLDLSAILKGDGHGGFNETEIRRVVRQMRASDRLRLIHIILDSCLPGDISAMIRMLEKYAASTFDIVGNLPEDVAMRILGYFNVVELLDVETVCKKWHLLVRHPAIWRHLCMQLTSTDPVPLRPPQNPEDWEPLYRSLHHRERNWETGQVQSIRFLKGHTGFCTTLLLKGNRLISGSYDETIRVWDVRSGEERKCLKVKAISCLDFLPDEEVLVAGFHDVGRVQVFSTVTWAPIQTLQGHLYGIRAVALSPKYLVSAGADKAIVCWDWRAGQKIVRFGQQTNLNIGVQIVDEVEGRIVGITIDGIVRTFSIPRREMLSQFKLSELGGNDPILSARLSNVGVGSANMLQWFAAKGNQMTCATKNLILHLEHEDQDPSSVILSNSTEDLSPVTPPVHHHHGPRHSLAVPRPESRARTPLSGRKSMGMMPISPAPSRMSSAFTPVRSGTSLGGSLPNTPNTREKKPLKPPVLLSVVETPDVAVGAVDPRKRRVATSTRFSSRAGADRRIFVSTYNLPTSRAKDRTEDDDEGESVREGPIVDFDTDIAPLTGAWSALAEESEEGWPASLGVPSGFKGLATPEKNPMAMALSHEEVVVGTADGTIYVMSFVGYQYRAAKEKEVEHEYDHAELESLDEEGEE
ncbi:F-box/WD repeat-containing protein pof1 [Ceratobasidium sp. AG-Ba]|nr:F-box/WD repeat-containing protein pof1 [Ceratobasidium sp. AG-Ba]QRW05263.1 F-box/WD repeat-containing protein pof1 [Ceratobasidium sp. AG-Ba]